MHVEVAVRSVIVTVCRVLNDAAEARLELDPHPLRQACVQASVVSRTYAAPDLQRLALWVGVTGRYSGIR